MPKHVICAGMYRACSTWQYEVVGHLLESRSPGGVARLGYLEGPAYRDRTRRDPDSAAGRAVLKCHDKHRAFDRAIRRGELAVVYAYRDLRDVADSMRHKMGLPLRRLMHEGLMPRILANDRYWSTRPGAVVQRYEDIMADPRGAVAELARGLGVELASGEADELAAHYSLEANRVRTEAMRRRWQAGGVDLADPANHQRYDPATLLHWNHLRQGRTGGWRESLVADEVARIDHQAGDWLVGRGYELDRTWAAEARARAGRLGVAVDGARARRAAVVYFAARCYPRAADLLRRAVGLGPLGTARASMARDGSGVGVTRVGGGP